MAILIAIFSILWGILVCIDNYWNIWLCIPIGLGIFILIYGFFWLCMFSANKITNAFAKVYNEKVVITRTFETPEIATTSKSTPTSLIKLIPNKISY